MKRTLMFFTLVIGIIATAFTLNGCDNTLTRKYGGTTDITLPEGHTFVNVTWKGDNIWILTKGPDGKYYFHEDSKWGLFEGTVKITESPK